MELIGYFSAIAIGISLGLIGGGGSILTVPVLVYLFNVEPVLATAYSLFIVGITSAAGSINYFKKGLVNIKTAIIFGIPSIIAVFATRFFVIPAIPDVIANINGLTLTKGIFLLLLFAVMMIAASYSMIRKETLKNSVAPAQKKANYILLVIGGAVVGVLTGLVGAGGGFLIIPALVVLRKLPMKEAIGTSLAIIASKSLIGFISESGNELINWQFLLTISVFSISGILIGAALLRRTDGALLKPIFGWFVLIMGVYIIIKEMI